MNDCNEVDIREALPDLVHGSLAELDMSRVLLHLDGCVDCADELAIIRSVLALASAESPTSIQIARIVHALPAYAPVRSRSRFDLSHLRLSHLRLAAALVVAAAGISTLVIEQQRGALSGALSGASSGASPAAQSVSAPSIAAGSAALRRRDAGVALVGTADLSDEHLAQLIKSMAHMDAAPPAEPESVVPAVLEGNAS